MLDPFPFRLELGRLRASRLAAYHYAVEHLDGSRLYCATDGCGVETIDFETRLRRPSVKADVAATARLADYLSSIGFYWPMVSAQDHPATAPLHELDAAFNHTVACPERDSDG